MGKFYMGVRLSPEQKTASDVSVFTLDHGVKKELPLEPSQHLWNHSPTGFNWGYMGSGPAQLALAILLDATGSKDIANSMHQRFKQLFVSSWGNTWNITLDEIRDWLKNAGVEECDCHDCNDRKIV